MIYINHQ